MTVYRKRPVEIEAVQFGVHPVIGETDKPIDLFNEPAPDWILSALASGEIRISSESGFITLTIHTREGVMLTRPGNWIIRGVQGELYPCDPDIFDTTYERVKDVA